MTIIKFDPNGSELYARAVFQGPFAASYTLKLSAKNSNTAIFLHDGDNQNDEDDNYPLPVPVKTNDGRVLRLLTTFTSLDNSMSNKYIISIEVFQNGQLIGAEVKSDKLSGKTQDELLFLKLTI